MKNLVIVCDEKRREFANYLMQLIGLEDDTEDTTVGIRDGSVQARVLLEKDYKAALPTISTTQYIVFIGNGKLLRQERSHMKNEFSKFGMTYSKLGRRAAIYVDSIVPIDEYNEFIKFAQKYEEGISKVAGVKAGNAIAMGIFLGPLVGAGIISFKTNAKIKDQMYSCAIMKFYLEELNKFLGLE